MIGGRLMIKKKKIKIQIVSWLNGSVLFEYESNDNTIKQTLEKAVSKNANLGGANLRNADLWDADLRGANLGGANLRNADLWGANLRGAKNISSDQTDYWWHIHHETLYEYLTEPIRARINYIKKEKPKKEVELRLKLLKPVLGKIPTTEKGWEALHQRECKDCSWNSKQQTIFPKK